MTLPGLPTTRAKSGTSFVITVPAPIKAYWPIVVPQITVALAPMEALFCAEMAHSISGMKADQANELVNRLLEKYENEVEQAPTGKRFQECYDLKTDKPTDDYQRLYEEVKDELTSLGITLQ